MAADPWAAKVQGPDTVGNPLPVTGAAGGTITVQGDTASGSADAGNPVKVGGVAQSAAPANTAAGNRVNAWYGQPGHAIVGVVNASATADGSTVSAAPAIDTAGVARNQAVGVQNFNGTNFDRQYNNTPATLLASAAHTTAQQSADQTNFNSRGVQITLNVTAASGTGGLTVQVQGKDPVSGNYYNLNANPTAVTATGLTVYELYPGIGAASGGVTQRTSGSLPRTWRVNVAVGDATSYTYSVGSSLIL